MSFLVFLVDGPERGTTQRWGFADEPDDKAVYSCDGVDYTCPGSCQQIDGLTYWHATTGPAELFRWWQSLHRDTRLRLSQDPYGPVPGDLIAEVTRTGQDVAGAFWPETATTTTTGVLRRAVQRWIADHPAVTYDWADRGGPEPGETTRQWYDRASAARATLEAEYTRQLEESVETEPFPDVDDPATSDIERRIEQAQQDQRRAARAAGVRPAPGYD